MDMGPDYPYVKYINGTRRMRMGPRWSNIANNVSGLAAYVQILVEGGGRASRTGQPLGNKFLSASLRRMKHQTDSGNSVIKIAPQVSPGAPRARILTFRAFWENRILLDPALKSIFLSKGRANLRSGDDF